ncbi:hypothetical protein OIE68_20115 [Nocardia vinacea]|uniref:Uncharacterized protein n=1 Tax=Nocardia vinacea TaxID=96468 RepID=A0ABZ1YXF5_9NOCA|nr:hypothetical protein OIE68_20115 [Nocardia vinacea]
MTTIDDRASSLGAPARTALERLFDPRADEWTAIDEHAGSRAAEYRWRTLSTLRARKTEARTLEWPWTG